MGKDGLGRRMLSWPCVLGNRRRPAAALQGSDQNTVKVLGMNKSAVTPVRVAKTLAEQKVDFTAEGSPPPGKVATAIPVSSPELEVASPSPQTVRGTGKLKRTPAASSP
jgi:hypothetical protein